MVQRYSCKCLNVRLEGQPNENDAEEDFKRLFVQDEGVQIIHSQLTIRSRALVNHGQRRIRRTTLTCLLCQTPAYRVTEDNPDTDLSEGPILNEDGEEQTLRSIDGWIEISKDCLTGQKLESAYSSPSYSPIFSILLPVDSQPRVSLEHASASYQPAPLDLNLPPLFLAPPFTSSHPIFAYISKLATKSAEEHRKQVRSELDTLIQQKIRELEAVENGMRRDVDVIWKQWRENWSSINNEPDVPTSRRRSSGQIPTIKDFEPSALPPSPPTHTSELPAKAKPQTPAEPIKLPAASLLSASLAHSSLHQFMAPANSEPEPTSPPIDLQAPPPSDADFTSGLVKPAAKEDHAIAVSYKFAMEDMAAMAKYEAQYEERMKKKLEKANAKLKDDENHRGRALPEGKHVQFAEAQDADADGDAPRTDDYEPELFDFDPLAHVAESEDTAEPPETSITPHASPGPRKTALPLKPVLSPRQKEPSPPADTPADSRGDKQLLHLVAAEAPSHRQAWKADGKGWQMFDGGRRINDDAELDDDESVDEPSEKSDWENPSMAAMSLPVNIGPLSTYGLGKLTAADARQPKSSLVDPQLPRPRAASASKHTKLSSSVITRERAYAARDLSISMDPGHSLHMPDSVLDELDEDDDSTTGDSETSPSDATDQQVKKDSSGDIGRKRAQLILQKKVGSVAPDAGMWRSLA
ncbi:hypothetical protein FRC02_009497 [Tulasnella sp. 418]|nr:hypothetical protein FRC02_009497 [Tulasnella sp. 418]